MRETGWQRVTKPIQYCTGHIYAIPSNSGMGCCLKDSASRSSSAWERCYFLHVFALRWADRGEERHGGCSSAGQLEYSRLLFRAPLLVRWVFGH